MSDSPLQHNLENPSAKAERRRKQEAASNLLTATVDALQTSAPAHEPPATYAARELMTRAWGLLGDAAYIETCLAQAASVLLRKFETDLTTFKATYPAPHHNGGGSILLCWRGTAAECAALRSALAQRGGGAIADPSELPRATLGYGSNYQGMYRHVLLFEHAEGGGFKWGYFGVPVAD